MKRLDRATIESRILSSDEGRKFLREEANKWARLEVVVAAAARRLVKAKIGVKMLMAEYAIAEYAADTCVREVQWKLKERGYLPSFDELVRGY